MELTEKFIILEEENQTMVRFLPYFFKSIKKDQTINKLKTRFYFNDYSIKLLYRYFYTTIEYYTEYFIQQLH